MVVIDARHQRELILEAVEKHGILKLKDIPNLTYRRRKFAMELEADGKIITGQIGRDTIIGPIGSDEQMRKMEEKFRRKAEEKEDAQKRKWARKEYWKDPEKSRRERRERNRELLKNNPEEYRRRNKRRNRLSSGTYCKGCNVNHGIRKATIFLQYRIICQLCENASGTVEVEEE